VLRFGIEAYLGARYGRGAIRVLQSDLFHDIVGAFIILALVITTISIIRLARQTRPARRRSPV
jgi:hypothetical protein